MGTNTRPLNLLQTPEFRLYSLPPNPNLSARTRVLTESDCKSDTQPARLFAGDRLVPLALVCVELVSPPNPPSHIGDQNVVFPNLTSRPHLPHLTQHKERLHFTHPSRPSRSHIRNYVHIPPLSLKTGRTFESKQQLLLKLAHNTFVSAAFLSVASVGIELVAAPI